MDTIETILNRRSVRRYSSQPVRQSVLQKIVQCGMAGPTCVNAREFAFIVVTDKDTLLAMQKCNGSPAAPLRDATAAVLVLGDMERTYKGMENYWIIDCAIAAQNIVLAAQDEGLANVMLGTWPQMERVKNLQQLFQLPGTMIPHTIIAMGYPEEDSDMNPLSEEKLDEKNEESRVHWEHW